MPPFDEVAELIRKQEVGRGSTVPTPFGPRLIFYADLTATGRFVHFVEAWLSQVRPYYANSHTAVSSTGRVMTHLREQARRVIAHAVGALSDDVVLFVGSGATAAINKLVGLLGLRISEPLERAFHLSSHVPPEQRPVVFVGPYEHHSNELPWVESIAEVIEIELDSQGCLSLSDLGSKLGRYADRPLRIGAFSAASNVTGLLTDVPTVAKVLHRGGAIACFDYAASAPYVPINMHPADPECRIDAVFVSPHKFMGGPNASGVLVAHRALFRSRTPERPGGGTVDYVGGIAHDRIDYVARLEEREEGGTPSIIGDLRAGAAFLLKDMLGPSAILEHETELARHALERLARHPRIALYGPPRMPRLPIVSFNIEGLHHDFVSTLLDHLFGIQNRAGCSCAGPYGHRLLGIDPARSELYRRQVARGFIGIKPGWVRVSLPYYGSKADIEFVLSAIELVADHGDKFLELYEFGFRDGIWRHRDNPTGDVEPISLTPEALAEAAALFCSRHSEAPGHFETMRDTEIEAARAGYWEYAVRLAADLAARPETPRRSSVGDPELDPLIWFRFVHGGIEQQTTTASR